MLLGSLALTGLAQAAGFAGPALVKVLVDTGRLQLAFGGRPDPRHRG